MSDSEEFASADEGELEKKADNDGLFV